MLFKKQRRVNAGFVYKMLKNFEEYLRNAIIISKDYDDFISQRQNIFNNYNTMITNIMNEIQRDKY